MRKCLECNEPPTHRLRCRAHWDAYRQRPGVRARQRRREALREGSEAASKLRSRLRADIRIDKWAVCAHCHGEYLPSKVQIDHIVPLYKGGDDTKDNVQVLCLRCHAIKTDMDMGRTPF